MTFLPSLPDGSVLLQVFRKFSATARPLLEYHEALMRGDSPFSEGELELIAGYVSGLNACHYCHGVHTAVAERFGLSEGLMDELLADPETAGIDDRMRPVLDYVRKLTLSPARMTRADADAVYAAGWDERALHDAVCVCALFNFMNRMVDGLGVDAGEDYFAMAGDRLRNGSYRTIIDLMDAD